MITQKYLDDLTFQIVGCSIEVHKQLGPGLFETVYNKCFLRELMSKGLHVQVYTSIVYREYNWILNYDLTSLFKIW
jgi:GxxExxY protein